MSCFVASNFAVDSHCLGTGWELVGRELGNHICCPRMGQRASSIRGLLAATVGGFLCPLLSSQNSDCEEETSPWGPRVYILHGDGMEFGEAPISSPAGAMGTIVFLLKPGPKGREFFFGSNLWVRKRIIRVGYDSPSST